MNFPGVQIPTDEDERTEQYPPPLAAEDEDSTLYPPPPQFIDSDGTLESIYVVMKAADHTYQNLLPPDDQEQNTDHKPEDPVYQNMSPNRNTNYRNYSTESEPATSTCSSSAPPTILSPEPPTILLRTAEPPTSSSSTISSRSHSFDYNSPTAGSDSPPNYKSPHYTLSLRVPRRYRRPSAPQPPLVRITSTYSEHPVSCYTPALHATRRALRRVRQNFSKKKSRSGETEKAGNVYDEYVIPGTQVETYVVNDFVFSRL